MSLRRIAWLVFRSDICAVARRSHGDFTQDSPNRDCAVAYTFRSGKGGLHEAKASYYRIDAKDLAGNGRLLSLPHIEPSLYNETIKPGRKIQNIEDK